MSLKQPRSYQRLAALYLVLTIGLVCCWFPWIKTGQAEEAGVQIVLTSTPPLEHIRPDRDLARVTLTALLHVQPLSQGNMQVQLTAPPRTQFVALASPGWKALPSSPSILPSRTGPGRCSTSFPSVAPIRLTSGLPLCQGDLRFSLPG